MDETACKFVFVRAEIYCSRGYSAVMPRYQLSNAAGTSAWAGGMENSAKQAAARIAPDGLHSDNIA
jgi:hypothetical protein